MPTVDFLMVGGKLEQETMVARFYTRVRQPTLHNDAFQSSQVTSVVINKETRMRFVTILYQEATFILISVMWVEVTQLMEGAQESWFFLLLAPPATGFWEAS